MSDGFNTEGLTMVSTDTHEPLKFSFIDAIRGYAILMVVHIH